VTTPVIKKVALATNELLIEHAVLPSKRGKEEKKLI
jgi:hypothetical protein